MAGEILAECGYSRDECQLVERLILATAMPQAPCGLVEEIMCDADLDSLGREDGIERCMLLHKEMIACLGIDDDETQWYKRQLVFFESHRYFTPYARQLRNEGKLENIQILMYLTRKS